MRIASINPTRIHEFQQRTAAGAGKTESNAVSIYKGYVQGLPAELDALVIASDLQGMATLQSSEASRLVGVVLAEELSLLSAKGTIPPPAKTGVILAGDLYSAPEANERGASGDVRPVWRAFSDRHRWVVGVAGIHDTFGDTREERETFATERRIALLDGNCVERDGMRIGGVGNIIGDASKPGRRDERDFLRSLRGVLAQKPTIVVLHHGPDAKRGELRGHPAIRQAFDRTGELLVICGHFHWPEPTTDMRGGAQALNVNGRVVVLERAPAP